MAQKTWKIGEYCKGGIITVKTSKTKVTIIGKEWDYSAGSTRGSNQSQAKEWCRLEVKVIDNEVYSKLNEFLNDLTTSYYADTILDWIEQTVTLPKYTGW